jgi:hypothetical protein
VPAAASFCVSRDTSRFQQMNSDAYAWVSGYSQVRRKANSSSPGGVVITKRAEPRKRKEPLLLGLLDVALKLSISIATARRYVLSGLLPSVRIAGRIRVPSEAVAKAQREGIGG